MLKSYDTNCPRCGVNFDAVNEKDNECPNCSLPFEWYIFPIKENDDIYLYIDMANWMY